MLLPKGLSEYLKIKKISSSDTDRIRQVVSEDLTLDEETRKSWLKYCKFASGAELFLNILSGTPYDSDD